MKSTTGKRDAGKRATVKRVTGKRGRAQRGNLDEGLRAASQAFQAGREQDALRILQPLLDVSPEVPELRELLGLAFYRVERYAAAAKELEVFAALTGSTEQYPVLMDCRRAQKRHADVERLWEDLRSTAQRPPVLTEGRIVMAGSLADRGELSKAIHLLERVVEPKGRVQDHHARLWYALADLEETVGNLSRARSLFDRVRAYAPDFADATERLAALS